MSIDLIGKVVRWSGHEWYVGMWFTAHLTGTNTWGGYEGVVVDPGNWSRNGVSFSEGQSLPNLRKDLIKPVEDEETP